MLSNNEKILYSVVVVVAVGAGMFILRQSKTTVQPTKAITYQDITSETNRVVSIDRMEKVKAQVRNHQTAPRLDPNIRDVRNELEDRSNVGLKLSGEKNHAEIDGADPSVYETPMNSLETQINKKLVNDQQAHHMSQIEKRNFIEAYKKRALAMGYKVELNDRLELIRADKVKTVGFDKPVRVGPDVDTMEEDQYIEDEE